MYKKRVSVSGWSPIGCEGFYTNLNIPCPLLTTFVGYSYDDHFNPHGFLWFSPISGDTFQTIPIIINSIPLLLIIIIIIVIIIIITIIIITGLSCSPIKTGFKFRHRERLAQRPAGSTWR